MSILTDIADSIDMQGKAFRFIFQNKMGWTLLVPVVLFIALSIVGIWSISELVERFVVPQITDEYAFAIPILLIFVKILFFILFGMWGGYLVVIIMSPFLAYVSEKTEKLLRQKEYPFNMAQFIKDIVRGILLAIRNCFMEIFVSILILLCVFVPIIGPFISLGGSTILLSLVSSYYYGFSFIDYTNERKKLTVRQSVNFVKSNKGTAIGHGVIFALILYIPIVGPFISAIFAVVATVAATMELTKKELATIDNTNSSYYGFKN